LLPAVLGAPLVALTIVMGSFILVQAALLVAIGTMA
jgi:hypothetical protein